MRRVPEPELMEDEPQARAYSEADFAEPHSMFVRLCREAWAGHEIRGRMLDLGCGPADVTVRLAKAFPALAIDGVDGSAAFSISFRSSLSDSSISRVVMSSMGVLGFRV